MTGTPKHVEKLGRPPGPRADADDGRAPDLRWPLGPLELPVLRVVWRLGRATVRNVLAEVTPRHPVAYTTVMTVMGRLAEKGLLRRTLVGKTHWYVPALTADQFTAAVSQQLLRSLVAEFGAGAIAQFAAQLDQVDGERLTRLQHAVEDQEPAS